MLGDSCFKPVHIVALYISRRACPLNRVVRTIDLWPLIYIVVLVV